MNTNKNQPLSFVGTILESSYTPVFFSVDENCERAFETTERGYTIAPVMSTLNYANATCDAFYRGVMPVAAVVNFTSLFDAIRNFWKKVTGQKGVEDAKRKLHLLIETVQSNFEHYAFSHEQRLQDLQKPIDDINRNKVFIKVELLRKLFVKLTQLEVKSAYSDDVYMEKLDLRKFPIKEKYRIIKEKSDYTLSSSKQLLHDYMDLLAMLHPIGLCVLRIVNNQRESKLKAQYEKIVLLDNDVTEQMMADIKQLSTMYEALLNVSNIFKDIKNVLTPILVNIVEGLSKSDFEPPVSDKIIVLSLIKQLLKELVDVVIVPNTSSEDMVKSVMEYSNNQSKKFMELKQEILKAAS